MKRVFVTGISGLLGANLCHELLNQEYIVFGLVRDKKRYKGKYHKNLTLVERQLFADFSDILTNVDFVIHIAAITDQNLLHYSDYWKINCDATSQLYNAAIKHKVKKFVFISTANTLGFGSLHNLGSEAKRMSSLFKKSMYAKSKKEAELLLLEKESSTKIIIINPTFMLGAYDSKPSSGKIILMGWKKRFIFYPPGGKNFVHVQDVASGIINALKDGTSGQHYLLANENLSYKQFFKKLNTVTDQKSILIPVPKVLLFSIGILGDLLRSVGIKTNMNLTNMKSLCIENYFSNNKSIEQLNTTYQPIENAILDAIQYFKYHKNG